MGNSALKKAIKMAKNKKQKTKNNWEDSQIQLANTSTSKYGDIGIGNSGCNLENVLQCSGDWSYTSTSIKWGILGYAHWSTTCPAMRSCQKSVKFCQTIRKIHYIFPRAIRRIHHIFPGAPASRATATHVDETRKVVLVRWLPLSSRLPTIGLMSCWYHLLLNIWITIHWLSSSTTSITMLQFAY